MNEDAIKSLNTFEDHYLTALQRLAAHGDEVSPRGQRSYELRNFVFRLPASENLITRIPGFETNVKYAEEELKWYYAATNRIDFSPLIERTWARFSDDGEHVNSAYGHRIFGKHPCVNVDQWKWCVDRLREDRDTRQAVINLNLPSDKLAPTKDFICTMFAQVFIRRGALEWHTYMRSQDIYFGTRNDVYCFSEMQKKMAEELQVGCGPYVHTCGSLHIYEGQFGKMHNALAYFGITPKRMLRELEDAYWSDSKNTGAD
jgi:thymidylate synthase